MASVFQVTVLSLYFLSLTTQWIRSTVQVVHADVDQLPCVQFAANTCFCITQHLTDVLDKQEL